MNLRHALFFALAVFFACSPAIAQTKVIENSGFAPGNIWFSREPTTAGETVQIYTLIWNASSDDLSGIVSFFDNDSLIGKQNFILAGAGSSKVLSTSWKVGEGYHKVYAQITESQGGPRGTKASTVSLEYGKTEETEQFISAPPKTTGSATSTTKNFVSEKLDLAKEYIEVNSPEPVVAAGRAVASSTDSFREGVRSWSENAVSNLKKELDEARGKKIEATYDEWLGTKRPLKYVALFLFSVATYIFGHPTIFYTLLVIVVFFVLRFIKRKFFF